MWLALLWYAAPLLTGHVRSNDVASRVRDTLVLGVAIPGTLGALDLLYAWSCVAAGVALAVVRTIVARPNRPFAIATTRTVSFRALPMLTTLVTAWPGLVRPLLNGDSLSYHLPNAAAWVYAHGIWVANTRYWWYPGGSELFAAGIFAVAGPFGLPVCGTLAALLLGLRTYDFALEVGLRPFAAGTAASALLAVHAIAQQNASLENDVWLSALLVEMLWCFRHERRAFVRTVLVTSLVKPVGVAFAFALLAFVRAPIRTAALGAIAIVAWALRDAVLTPRATIAPGASGFAHIWTTTIAWHGSDGVATLVRASFADGPLFALLLIATIATMVRAADRSVRFATIAFAALFFIEPFGFDAEGPLLAIGSSLRYGFPAFVFGGIGALGAMRRYQAVLAPPLLVITAYEVVTYVARFTADASVDSIVVITILAAIAAFLPLRDARYAVCSLLALAFVAYAGRIAAIHPSGYYDDELTANAGRPSLFAWLQHREPASIVGRLFPLGEAEIVSPHTVTTEAIDDGACELARDTRSLLVTALQPGPRPAVLAAARANARACGPAVFEDAYALVVDPR